MSSAPPDPANLLRGAAKAARGDASEFLKDADELEVKVARLRSDADLLGMAADNYEAEAARIDRA